MTCPTCIPWAATSIKQYRNRLRNRAAIPTAAAHPCPSCGGTDWSTTKYYIKSEPERWLDWIRRCLWRR